MTTRIALTVALLTAAATVPAGACAQGAFERVVTSRMDAGQGGPAIMEYSIKGEKARLDMTVQGMNMYTLFDAGTMDMAMPTRQMYSERAIQSAHARADSAADKTRRSRTGRKETIAGYECERATITSANGSTTDVCLAKGLGTFVQMGGGTRERNGAMGGGWEDAVGKTFPLKVQKGDRVVMEAIRVEKKILDPSLFAVPDGYQKMGMGMEMGGCGGR